jgi:SAM-dependent methyltransferase
LIPERSSVLAKRFPEITVLPGDAFEIEKGDGFDVVFQGTVFSSILDPKLRQSLAEKMKSLLRPGGIILWYDFTFDNPKNKNVTGIRKKEILENYGPWSKAEFYRVTLAPPLGRRIGPLYPLVNALFPFLRTHIAGCLKP